MPGVTRFREPFVMATADASRTADVRVPISVLSVHAPRAINCVVRVIGATVAQGLALIALFGHSATISVPVEVATIEWARPPPVALAEPEPEPVTVASAAEETATPEVAEADLSATEQTVVADARSVETETITPPMDDPAPSVTLSDDHSPEVATPALLHPVMTPPVERVPTVAATASSTADPVKPSHDWPPAAHPVPRSMRHVAAPVNQPTQATISAAVSMIVPRLAGLVSGAPDPRADMILRAAIREAVQAAVRCPAGARMMKLSGTAGVAFDYRDGTVIGDARLTRSAGAPMLDAAALEAVRHARYPAPPPEAANHLLRLLVWVDEACAS
jgi:protein TonB